jgi:hypothetical protein
MTMIERVIKALSDSGLGDVTEAAARAAIEVMREPSEAMKIAAERMKASDVTENHAPFGVIWAQDGDGPTRLWSAMIDAALSEAGPEA